MSMQSSAEIWDSTVSLNTSQQISTSGGIFVCEIHSALLLFCKRNLIYYIQRGSQKPSIFYSKYLQCKMSETSFMKQANQM